MYQVYLSPRHSKTKLPTRYLKSGLHWVGLTLDELSLYAGTKEGVLATPPTQAVSALFAH
jgi:hypothetical protein